MGAYPEVFFLRRFGALGAQNLLYLQAELVELEHEFQECSRENERSTDTDRATFSKDWYTLAHADGGRERQWGIMLQIRQKLKEYGASYLSRLLSQIKTLILYRGCASATELTSRTPTTRPSGP